MDMNEILRKMREAQIEETKKKPDADKDGIPDWADKNPDEPGGDEDRKIEESINIELDGSTDNIELDGPEADAFLSRLMQLSGQGSLAAQPAGVPAPMDAMPAMPMEPPMDMPPEGMPEPMDVPMDVPPEGMPEPMDAMPPEEMPAPAGDMDGMGQMDVEGPVMTDEDSKFICDDCGEGFDSCTCSEGVCEDCGMPLSMCECDMSVSTHGPLDSVTLENADHDHGHDDVEDEGEVVDPETYMWQPSTPPQRMVKGVMGDNPMMKENMGRFTKLVDSYVNFLRESNEPVNADGMASPLTAADRTEFDKDPSKSEEPVTDGSRSPMTDIKRQDVMK